MPDQELSGAFAVVALPGQIDLTSQDRAYDQLCAAFASGAAVVVADFTATTFCDCSAMRRLLAAQHHAAARQAQLLLAIPPGGAVRRLADLLGVHRRVPVYPGVREALAALQPPGTKTTRPDGPAPRPPGRTAPPPGQDTVTIADITDVIGAHSAFTARLQAAFTGLSRQASGPASRAASHHAG